jgi:hypothetical protein
LKLSIWKEVQPAKTYGFSERVKENVQQRLVERVVQTGCRKHSKKAGMGHQPSERNVRNVQRSLERDIGNTRFKEGWNGTSEMFKKGWNGSTIGTDRQKRAAKKAETVIGNV